MLIVDAHLDLAYNALKFNRDLRQPVNQIRAAEVKRPCPNGRALTSFPDLREAGIGLVFGTLFVAHRRLKSITPHPAVSYSDADEAHLVAMRQLDYYYRMADALDYVRLVGDRAGLEAVLASQAPGRQRLVGVVPLMEGADPIRRPEELPYWHERGLRLIGLAWDDTKYAAGGWGSGGGLTDDGRRLLEAMAEFNFILDLTHMSEQATLEALDSYPGPIVATHSNARHLLSDSERHLTDEQIRRLAERGGMTGVVLYNRFLHPSYGKGDPKEKVTLEHVIAQIDHICQLVGSAQHVGIGTDFDGGFGAADIPLEIETVSDLALIGQRLTDRGYNPDDVRQIMGWNWVRTLQTAWG